VGDKTFDGVSGDGPPLGHLVGLSGAACEVVATPAEAGNIGGDPFHGPRVLFGYHPNSVSRVVNYDPGRHTVDCHPSTESAGQYKGMDALFVSDEGAERVRVQREPDHICPRM